jgi:hypothetical protein
VSSSVGIFPIYGKIKVMFQTTNQFLIILRGLVLTILSQHRHISSSHTLPFLFYIISIWVCLKIGQPKIQCFIILQDLSQQNDQKVPFNFGLSHFPMFKQTHRNPPPDPGFNDEKNDVLRSGKKSS